MSVKKGENRFDRTVVMECNGLIFFLPSIACEGFVASIGCFFSLLSVGTSAASRGRRRQSPPPPGEVFDAFAGTHRLSVSRSGWRLVGEANAIWIFGWSAGLDNGGRRREEGVRERGTGEVFEIFGAKAKGRKEWRERGKCSNRRESSTVRFHIKIGVTFCGLRWACFFPCLLNCGSVFLF